MLITVIVTIVFDANVEAQGGAYATGVLVLMSSAALAVALTAWRRANKWPLFGAITLIFFYTTVTNVFERPEGIKIASVFILTIIVTSLVSRALRSTELRVLGIKFDPVAASFVVPHSSGQGMRIIAHRPGQGSVQKYAEKLAEARESHHIPEDDPVLFLEVMPGDSSAFSEVLHVHGVDVGGHHVLRCQSPAVPNAIAEIGRAHV